MGIRLAAIDVGSNAIRFALGEINKKNIEIIHSYRVPIRLGSDSFSKRKISDKTIGQILRAFSDFQKVMVKHKVKFYKAVATSALRDAKNKKHVVDLIFAVSHIKLDIIKGIDEAKLVHLGVSHVENISKKNALLMDIGGGSVEFVISVNGRIKKILSLDMGTVRMLNRFKRYRNGVLTKKIQAEVRKKIRPLKKYRKLFLKNPEKNIAIGTGGNVKALNRLSTVLFHKSKDDGFSQFEADLLEKIICGYSVTDRVRKLGLKPDRADVVLPAAIITLEIMQLFQFKSMRAPNVGLKDGILIQLSNF